MRVCFAILYDIVLDTPLYHKISLDCPSSCLLYYSRIFLRTSYKNMLHCKSECHVPYDLTSSYHIVTIMFSVGPSHVILQPITLSGNRVHSSILRYHAMLNVVC